MIELLILGLFQKNLLDERKSLLEESKIDENIGKNFFLMI
jgi:hypothetical protein